MTIGIAAFGPKSGAGVVAGLRAVELVGRGAIGGFVSFAALTNDGRLLRASTQTGGAGSLFDGAVPEEIALSPLAGLISSGPNRPEPLSEFVAAEPGVGIVTGHRMPQTPAPDGVPLNLHVLQRMKDGADPQAAIDAVIARYPDMDAGFVAFSMDGSIGMGNMPTVMTRGDHGSAILNAPETKARVASIHNAIHPHRLVAAAATETALDAMLRPDPPSRWIEISAGAPLCVSEQARVVVDENGVVEQLCHPANIYLSGEWSVGLGDRVAVFAQGKQIGWLGYEPFMKVVNGKLQSIDGKDHMHLPLLDRVPY
ncbi:DUF6963 family protein [Puniceibacterium sediminis]|uniref:Uncharacterized protein n=1 Tax=Puniceibacterium sediminis TaxID=1608407 RepID=A0A238X445_9RHOB|nr:hypothetical protein [Puniceibacterium sediminis]SNR53371.1 hypothetical protein SAMN06265370_10923 [Puniceibacterium sediminis]